MISIIIPTCKRPEILKRMLKSLYETTKGHEVEVIAVVDDDIQSAQIVLETDCILDFSHNRRSVLSLWNKGLTMAHGELIHPAMDDLIYHENWLEYGIESHKEKLGGHGLLGFNDLAYNGNTQVATQFMFDIEYCKHYMGGVIAPPDEYKYLCIDVEINEKAKMNGRFYWDKRAIVEHAHSAHNKRPYDEHDEWKDRNNLSELDGEILEKRRSLGFPITWESLI